MCVALLIGNSAFAQIFIPGTPPESEFGRVVLDKYASAGGPGPVVFDHWLHRSKFTCRLCHVDIGFAMKAKATDVKASTNQQGFHCGTCHDGKRVIEGKTIFPACSSTAGETKQCARCHSLNQKGARNIKYEKFTAKFPRGAYGVSWEAAERAGLIKPIDILEGVSIQKGPLKNRDNFSIKAHASLFSGVIFSHEKHSVWNGCEVCHPDIFPTTKKGEIGYSMYQITRGRYCGACHGKVAFPVNGCAWCHPKGMEWVDGPGRFP